MQMRYTGLLVFVFFAVTMLPAGADAVGPGKTLTWAGGGKGRVVFEGSEHAEKGYRCKACHPGLFSMKQGAAKITMAALNAGKFCGACHNGTTAFGTNDPKKCRECHKGNGHHDGHGRKHDHEDHDDD